MIVGLGVDIVKVSRVEEKLADRILSNREQEIWMKNKRRDFLAGRFALKEAFFKAVGTGIRNYNLKDISFIPDALGALHIEENDVVTCLKKEYDFDRVHSTLSHDGGIGVAVVILEKGVM